MERINDFKTFVAGISETTTNDSVSNVNEADIKSDEDFKEYAEVILKKAFGEDYDAEKAKATIDGIIQKNDGDYGAMVGVLQASM